MASKSLSIWYPRYVGDYQRKTSHLSLLQHGAYSALLDHYYATGKPLPANASVLHRVCRAFAPDEQAAVQAILDEFFTLEADGYHNSKADEELLKRSNISEKRKLAAIIKHKKKGASAHANAPASAYTSTAILDTDTNVSVRKPRRTRIAKDWQPTPDDYQHARSAGLDHSEIAADLAQFIEYWSSDEPRNPAKANWSRTYRNHITDYAPRVIGRRASGNKPFGNGRGGNGLAAYLRKTLVEEPLSARSEMQGFGSFGDSGACVCGGPEAGTGNGGTVIDADEWKRVEEVAD